MCVQYSTASRMAEYMYSLYSTFCGNVGRNNLSVNLVRLQRKKLAGGVQGSRQQGEAEQHLSERTL